MISTLHTKRAMDLISGLLNPKSWITNNIFIDSLLTDNGSKSNVVTVVNNKHVKNLYFPDSSLLLSPKADLAMPASGSNNGIYSQEVPNFLSGSFVICNLFA